MTSAHRKQRRHDFKTCSHSPSFPARNRWRATAGELERLEPFPRARQRPARQTHGALRVWEKQGKVNTNADRRAQASFIQLDLSPVVYSQADIFCSVLQGDVGVLRAELDVLAAGVGHCEGQGHGLELLGCGLVVPDVHQTGNEILINLRGERAAQSLIFWHDYHTHLPEYNLVHTFIFLSLLCVFMFRCTQALVRTNTVPVSSVRLVLDLLPIQPFQYLKGKTAKQERHCAGEGPFFPTPVFSERRFRSSWSQREGRSGLVNKSRDCGSRLLLLKRVLIWTFEQQVQCEFADTFRIVELRLHPRADRLMA